MNQDIECPLCRTPMLEQPFGSTCVHFCSDGCGGLWFEADELKRLDFKTKGSGTGLKAALTVSPKPAMPERTLACPHCSDELSTRCYERAPEVEIDICNQCYGIFLDAGEFAALRERSLTTSEVRADQKQRRRRRTRQQKMKHRYDRGDTLVDRFLFPRLLRDD
jgi:Zn-finger nucleic acid-binding protein